MKTDMEEQSAESKQLVSQSGHVRTNVTICVDGLAFLLCVTPLFAVETSTAGKIQQQEIIEIMRGVNFVPQLGADNPLCKSFYEDFRKQTNIKYIQPILKAGTYDDPALKPYRDQCPSFDFRKSLSVPANWDTTGWTEEDWEISGTPTFGMGNFQLYRVDIDNNPKNGEELVFYYEGERTIVKRLPYGKPMTEEEYVDSARRGYHVLDLLRCKNSTVGGVVLNDGGSATWTRSGVIQYKGKNSVYVLKSEKGDQPNFRYLDLWMYSARLKRMAPACTYLAPQ